MHASRITVFGTRCFPIFIRYWVLLILLLLSACSPAPHYPAHWFAPVPRSAAASWEILPQDAAPGEVILSKRNELGLLSNFAATPFTYHNKKYASLEGFWQSLKYPESPDDPRATFPGLTWPYTRAQVEQLTGFDAKHAGDAAEKNMQTMHIDWVTFENRRMDLHPQTPDTRGEHYHLIVEVTWAKVLQNQNVRDLLLSTGHLILKPDHHQPQNAPAAWRYFDILTQIRTALQKDPSAHSFFDAPR